jgi:hypothetical protein
VVIARPIPEAAPVTIAVGGEEDIVMISENKNNSRCQNVSQKIKDYHLCKLKKSSEIQFRYSGGKGFNSTFVSEDPRVDVKSQSKIRCI